MAIGIDIVYIPRMRNKDVLAKRILSPEEFTIYSKRMDKDEFLAGRFAAKEAFLKAKRSGVGQVPFHTISVIYDSNGAPVLLFNNQKYEVSISHDGEYAVAVVIIEEMKK